MVRFPLVSRTDHITLPMPSILRLFAMPLIEAPLGSFLMLPGTKSLLSKVTLWLAPESHITLKLSIGSMAALHATGCCRTTASESRQLQLWLHSCHPFGVGISPLHSCDIAGVGTGGNPFGEEWLSVGEPIGVLLGESMGIPLEVTLGGWNKG